MIDHTVKNNSQWIIMEMCDKGDLEDIIKQMQSNGVVDGMS